MTDQSEPITVIIVDDHEMVRRGASSYLEAQPDISLVAQVGSGAEAVRLAQEFIPDVVLMDLVMPDMDGVEATRRVKSISPRTQVVILTSFHQDEYVFPALQAGAISYLLKDVRATELLEAIRRAARGEATLHPRIAARVIKTFRSLAPDEETPFTALTERELEVLKLLRSELSGPEIARQLIVSLNTLRTHTKNIFNKLGVNNRRAAVRRAEELDLF